MDTERESGLKLYSLGIVIEAKDRNSDVVKVWPIEELSLVKGEVGEANRNVKVSSKDRNGTTKTASVKVGEAIEAKWIPDGHSNRETPPDVQPNETIKIYRYADTNEFYWTTLFREPELRRLETVRYVFSNQPSGLEKYDEDTSYWYEVSTHDKRIRLHTSENDGEACTYDLEIDTKRGIVTFNDNLGNSIELNSPAGVLTATTENEVIVNTKRYIVNASESIQFNSPNIERNYTTAVDNGDAVTTNSKAYFKDGMAVQGTGANGGSTSASFKGSMEIDGDVHATGSIIDDSGNTPNHSH